MEKQLDDLEIEYPLKARGVAKFNVKLAHMIIAGADFIIVPSRFEPCGLIQLQAMPYGCVSIQLITCVYSFHTYTREQLLISVI